jgi:protein SCO1/2
VHECQSARVLLLAMALTPGAAGCHRPGLPRIAQVPQFVLRDQDGAELRRDGMRGRVWIANFMFTSCPDVCPLLTAKMSGVRGRLVGDRADVRYVSFSVDPAHDTPAVLKKYALEHGADLPDWRFLTGPLQQVEQVIVSGFKQALQPGPEVAGKARSILHGSHFVLIDRALSIRGYYPSDEEGLLRLARDARILLAEKAENPREPS